MGVTNLKRHIATVVKRHFECQLHVAIARTSGKACIRMASQLTESTRTGYRCSSYYQALDETVKTRYNEKLKMLGGMKDPYVCISAIHQQERMDWLTWPDVEYP